MPSVVGVMSRRGEDVSNSIAEMLSTLKHRGSFYAGAAIGDEVVFSKNANTIDFQGCEGFAAVGYNGFEKLETAYQPLIDCTGNLYGVLDGRVFNSQELMKNLTTHDVDASVEGAVLLHSVEEEKKNLLDSVSSVLQRVDGVYAFAVKRNDTVALARDPVGVRSLYWGENDSVFAFASERKALWKIRVDRVETFPPGNVGVISSKKREVYPALLLKKPPECELGLNTVATELGKVLIKAVQKRVEGLDEIGLLFSGGVDSALIAKALKDLTGSIQLFTAGVEGAHDVAVAEKAATSLQLSINIKTISPEEIEQILPRVAYLVEEWDLMKVGVALPLFIACKEALSRGFRTLLAGQGSDELFAGYNRYLRTLRREGYEAVNTELWKDLLETHRVNLSRDSAVAAANGLELLLPYLDLKVINLAVSLPAQYKIEGGSDRLRKRVLRKAAELQGVPKEIANIPKKAVQYSSGADKAIRRLAKARGYGSVENYLRSVFNNVFKGFPAAP